METILDKNMVARLSLNALLKESDRFDILFPNIKDSDISYGYKFYVFKDKFDIWWNEDRFFPKQPMAEDLTILKNFIKNMSDLTDKWFSDKLFASLPYNAKFSLLYWLPEYCYKYFNVWWNSVSKFMYENYLKINKIQIVFYVNNLIEYVSKWWPFVSADIQNMLMKIDIDKFKQLKLELSINEEIKCMTT